MKKKKKKNSKTLLLSFSFIVIISVSIFGITRLFQKEDVPEEEILAVIKEDPFLQNYVQYPVKETDIHEGMLILVNQDFAYTGHNEFVNSLKNKVSGYKVKNNTVTLEKTTQQALNDMLSKYSSIKKDYDITIVSGVRTVEEQTYLMNRKINEVGEEEAKKWLALPTKSEHHTGLAIDLGVVKSTGAYYDFDGLNKQAWILENCANYGFVLRYEQSKVDITQISYEPWHFRYVGKVHASFLKEKEMCLEEYITFLKQHPFKENHLITGDHEIYYAPYEADKGFIYVPKDGNYEVSGNNIDGFIVTHKK